MRSQHVLRTWFSFECIEIESEELAFLQQSILVLMNSTTDYSQVTADGRAINCFILERVVVFLKQIMSLFTILIY